MRKTFYYLSPSDTESYYTTDALPQCTPSILSPTTPNQYNLLRNEEALPSTNQPQVYRALLHQTSVTYWEMRRPSTAKQPQVYRALLHQTSITWLRNQEALPH